ncbi:MAG: chemotaxis protein [Bacteroidetes bacterium HGW-Bacteroidetes-5]|jgi:methyl-accepting chemotaxis protein|nr:MAG: chemotaxis protein [Bacteroidetes bacterium HGW-Bacteroidetes-5]
MENSLKIKTRGKLIIGFAIMVISTVAIISLTYNNIRKIESINRSIQEMDSIAYEVTGLRAKINTIRAMALELIVDNESTQIFEKALKISGADQELVQICLNIDSMLVHEKDIRADFRVLTSDVKRYVQNRELFLSLIKDGKKADALTYVKEKQNDIYNKITNNALNIESNIMKIRRDYLKANAKFEYWTTFQAILFGTFLILLNLFMAIFILRMIRKITSEIRSGIEVLYNSSSNILNTITDISTGASETAAAVSETTATIEEVRQTATLSNQKAKSLIESSHKVSDSAEKGKKSLAEVIKGMEQIDIHMNRISGTVVKLSEQNRRIGEITSTVSDIADQSNLLAVNAAIEAAKAGEHGRGFTVVAQEIRNLADQSKRATLQVKEILNEVNKSVNNAVEATDDAAKRVEAGKSLVMQSGEVIEMLAENIEEAGEVSLQISSSNHQQMAGMDQIVPAMENIKKASEQNVAGMQKAQSATHEIHTLGQTLKRILIKYNL